VCVAYENVFATAFRKEISSSLSLSFSRSISHSTVFGVLGIFEGRGDGGGGGGASYVDAIKRASKEEAGTTEGPGIDVIQ